MLFYWSLKGDPLSVAHDFVLVGAFKGNGKDVLPTLCGLKGHGSDLIGPRCAQCEALRFNHRVFMVEDSEVTKFPKARYWELFYRGTQREPRWASRTLQFATVYMAYSGHRPVRIMRIDYEAHKLDANGERIEPLDHKVLWWGWKPTRAQEDAIKAEALRSSGFKAITK